MANLSPEVNNNNSNEYYWVQYYQQQQQLSHRDSTVTTHDDDRRPMARRRSRASKKTPTTLLNANANNFRELVQHFTGCPTSTTSIPVKGPVNLNFSLKNATPIILGTQSPNNNNNINNHQLQQYYSSSPVNNTTFTPNDGFPIQDHDLSVYDFAIFD